MKKHFAFMLTITAGLFAARFLDAIALAAFLPFAVTIFKIHTGGGARGRKA